MGDNTRPLVIFPALLVPAFVLGALLGAPADVAAGAPPPGAVPAQLVKVINGDTIDVSIAGKTERVRDVGVDTPERGQPGYQAATEANRALLGSGPLYLVRDVSDRDKTSSKRLIRGICARFLSRPPGAVPGPLGTLWARL